MSIGTEIDLRHNTFEHIKYILGVLRDKEHETWGLSPTMEAIDYYMPENFDFNARHFMIRFTDFLFKLDIIPDRSEDSVHKLCARIIAITGRNYRIIELIQAFEIMLRAWEIQVGSLEPK